MNTKIVFYLNCEYGKKVILEKIIDLKIPPFKGLSFFYNGLGHHRVFDIICCLDEQLIELRCINETKSNFTQQDIETYINKGFKIFFDNRKL